MEGQGDGRHNGPNCYRIPLPIGNGARNMETLGLRVFILNQEIIFSIHAMIRPPDNDVIDNDGNNEDNDEDDYIEDNEDDNDDEEQIDDDNNIEDNDQEENIEDNENIEDDEEDVTEDSDGDADVEDNDAEMEEHHEYHADNNNMNDMHMNDENAVLLFRIRVRPLQHGDVFDDIFLELRLVNNDDFDEIDNNEDQNGEVNEENIEDDQNIDEDDGFENVVNAVNNTDDEDNNCNNNEDPEENDCNNDEGFEDFDNEIENIEGRSVIGNVVNEKSKHFHPGVYQDLDDPLPGPSRERSIEDEDDETSRGKQFQWWDDCNSDSFSDNIHEDDDYHRCCTAKQRSSDDVDSQDDRWGKKTRKKNFISKSEDEDFAFCSSDHDADEDLPPESSRKRPRGEGGHPSETGRREKRFRHSNTSGSDLDEVQPDVRPGSSSNRLRDNQDEETKDSEK
ncbi:protein PFC0760c-like [Phyllopteryx taeniolatus]|uniref:protein PFC0760c-like n=1 Tax=Phyllopteryx taeniolatus TaxID=161469 RepID=UPI002AD3DE9D|nr:protein PFC0760c-like [Phyllopteryx taeniolatus]XP_061612181.1 protein PFC0760c-like [Phyllopteryx taeniolatus]